MEGILCVTSKKIERYNVLLAEALAIREAIVCTIKTQMEQIIIDVIFPYHSKGY